MGLPTCILFYDADGNVVGTLDYLVQYDEDGVPIGVVDFESHELAGGRLRDIALHSTAVGAGTWPEWLSTAAHDFKVNVRPGPKGGTHLIQSLEHKTSGHRRERVAVASAIDSALVGKGSGDTVNITSIVGSPERALILDSTGRTVAPVKRVIPELPRHPKV